MATPSQISTLPFNKATATILPVRPAPAKSGVPNDAPQWFRDYASKMDQWCREVEASVKKLGTAATTTETKQVALTEVVAQKEAAIAAPKGQSGGISDRRLT